jgi:predicted SnoaL-like aldol condensation-catalyzing enzyme
MGKNQDKIAEYISAEQYDQHNPQIKDGLSGLENSFNTWLPKI